MGAVWEGGRWLMDDGRGKREDGGCTSFLLIFFCGIMGTAGF